MARVSRTEQAQQDLEAILDYPARQGTQTADRFALKFDETCELHADHPLIGGRSEE
jgi:plasmid stabilization system protein ParE